MFNGNENDIGNDIDLNYALDDFSNNPNMQIIILEIIEEENKKPKEKEKKNPKEEEEIRRESV